MTGGGFRFILIIRVYTYVITLQRFVVVFSNRLREFREILLGHAVVFPAIHAHPSIRNFSQFSSSGFPKENLLFSFQFEQGESDAERTRTCVHRRAIRYICRCMCKRTYHVKNGIILHFGVRIEEFYVGQIDAQMARPQRSGVLRKRAHAEKTTD